MTEKVINDYLLDKYARSCAEDIMSEARTYPDSEVADMVWQYADGSEYVIYPYRAHQLCLYCNTDRGEEFVEECYSGHDWSQNGGSVYDNVASAIAYGEIQARIFEAIGEIEKEKEDAA